MDLPGHTSGGSSGASGRFLTAISQLSELVRRFNHRSFDEVVAFEWGEYPRCVECSLDELDPTAHELVRQKCRLFLELAVGELEPLHPTPVGDVSPIAILRRHVLEGDTWDVILAERKELGQPRLAERTLKNRQREGLRLVMKWAAGKPTGEEHQLDLPFSRRRERILRAARWVGGSILAVLIAWGLIQLRPTEAPSLEDQLRTVDPSAMGVRLTLRGTGSAARPSLEEILPGLELPSLPRQAVIGMLVPMEDATTPSLLLVTDSGSEGGGIASLWDPLAAEFRWELAWEPPAEEVRTHPSLTEPVHEEAWGIRDIGYRNGIHDLGEQLVLVYQQRFSPTFILFVDKKSGEARKHYAHPGHIGRPFILDLNGDGRPELLLTGTDNATNRPCLVVLDPEDEENAAASTVMWNEKGEGALYRILFPAVPELERFHRQPRQALEFIDPMDWMPESQILLVRAQLGAMTASTYMCYLRHGWKLLPENPMVLEDLSQPTVWGPAGMKFEKERDRLIGEVELIPGRGFAYFAGANHDDGQQGQ